MRFFRKKPKEVEAPLVGKPEAPSVTDTPEESVQKSQDQSEGAAPGLKTVEETYVRSPLLASATEAEQEAAQKNGRDVGAEARPEESASKAEEPSAANSGPLGKKAKGKQAINEGAQDFQPASGPQTAAEIKKHEGLLVTIVSARNLRNADAGNVSPTGKKNVSDPFAVCELNRIPHTRMVTQVMQDNLNPTWSCEKQFQYYTKGDPLYFAVYDYDTPTQKDLLGSCVLDFSTYYPNGYEGDIIMESLKNTGAESSIRVKVQVLGQPRSQTPMADWYRSERQKDRKGFEKPLYHRQEFVEGQGIAVTILCASNLPNRDARSGRPDDKSDPWVQVVVPNRPDSFFNTTVVRDNLDPVWNYTGQLYSYKIGDPIKFVIWDKDEGHAALKGDMLGKVEVPWEDWKGGLEARLQLPDSSNTSCGKHASFLSLKIEILGPPLEPPQKAKPKEEVKVSLKARETKHIFLEFLRHRRGTTFRGWRLDVDRRCNNRVSYTDLMASCRFLGLSLAESRRIWSAFRPPQSGCPASPIEYQEFDPEEWQNLNAFLEVLWEELNFNLDLIWSVLDPKGKGFITYEEFAVGMDRMSFDGDAQLVFSGLDTGGQGRLWRHELDVLKLLPPESHASAQSSPPIMEFKEWANDRYGGPQALIKDLGMSDKSGPTTAKLLASKLQTLGFKGDILHLNTALTKFRPLICWVDLMEMLDDKRVGPRQSLSYAGRKWGFTPPDRRKTTFDSRMDKPVWNSCVFNPALINSRLGRRERHYFCKPFDRPIRDEIMQELGTRGYNFRQEGDRGLATDRSQSAHRSRQAVGGPQALLESDIQKVTELIKEHCPEHPDVLHSVAEEAVKSHQKAVARAQAAAAANPPSSPRPIGNPPICASLIGDPTRSAKQARVVDLNGEFKIRVFLLGAVGLSSEDDESSMLNCSCELIDKPDWAFKYSIEREMFHSRGARDNRNNMGEMTGVVIKDALEFTISEPEANEALEDEEEIMGIASLTADKFLPNGFDGRLKILDENEEHMEGTFLLVKVEVLS